ncbi:two-component system, response regulator YcbB [Seinonella peptonophila]|uniref:Two-component system, response regulator YcbB n=1 Tax=Seinonella peptonophila TaxID=112248 RepID=A0A1M4Z5Z2_9BACL|nr:response regulator [Seinonella peptonophila]SHF13202.1 two-component system, response regulator YcbB [Seinonella peptonophila]
MRFFLVDDDDVVRMMLTEIIEEEGLGEVIQTALDGSTVTDELLQMNHIDILIIDLMMPVKDGLATVRTLETYQGKVIMISQVESKEMVEEAYTLGVEYYITKPINRVEVCTVIRRVQERMKLEQSISDIKKSLRLLDLVPDQTRVENPFTEKSITTAGRFLLGELGIEGESGEKDLLAILRHLFQLERNGSFENDFPLLKNLFDQVARHQLGSDVTEAKLKREVKAMEQRIRRAIEQSLAHLASIGLTDYAHPKFEKYASRFFDFTEIRKKMIQIQKPQVFGKEKIRINMKKFIQILYFEAKRAIG